MPVAEYELRELDWDTEFFGMKMGRVVLPSILESMNFSELAWLHTLESARRLNFQFLYCPFNVDYPEVGAIIAGHGATIGDILVTFTLDCFKGTLKHSPQRKVKEALSNDLEGIIEIAAHSFRDSRFMKDPHFDKVKAEQFYPSWLQESFASGEKILVVKEEQQVLGFISLKAESLTQTMVIRLIAVRGSERGKGVGQILIDQALHLAADQKYHFVQVGTQLTNTAAINLYEKNGFRIRDAKYRYHIWLDEVSKLQIV
ncbi:MAG TPA: hypothetical protein DDW50_15615 [Firmicutes bacterium]|jgi:dTDP-4-amino-4,6-dideoxy-D-galactose acyltransferase|nr:hypothetical protein [Bacillota bacterium]